MRLSKILNCTGRGEIPLPSLWARTQFWQREMNSLYIFGTNKGRPMLFHVMLPSNYWVEVSKRAAGKATTAKVLWEHSPMHPASQG